MKNETLIILFTIITIIIFGLLCFTLVIKNIKPLQQNWASERCKPQNMMFAGVINKPPDSSISDYTFNNFKYCTQKIN
jgi:hypothetical protein